jgi:hypothetical protein
MSVVIISTVVIVFIVVAVVPFMETNAIHMNNVLPLFFHLALRYFVLTGFNVWCFSNIWFLCGAFSLLTGNIHLLQLYRYLHLFLKETGVGLHVCDAARIFPLSAFEPCDCSHFLPLEATLTLYFSFLQLIVSTRRNLKLMKWEHA